MREIVDLALEIATNARAEADIAEKLHERIDMLEAALEEMNARFAMATRALNKYAEEAKNARRKEAAGGGERAGDADRVRKGLSSGLVEIEYPAKGDCGDCLPDCGCDGGAGETTCSQ